MTTRSRVAAPFLYKNTRNGKISEYNIRYTPGVNDARKLAEFLQECDDEGKNVNIEMAVGFNVDDLWAVSHFENLRVRICDLADVSKMAKMREKGIRFFFDEKFAACNWKQLSDQISLGCCQIYVADDLTHSLEKVYNICSKNEVGIRCVLNHVHSFGPYKGTNETDWFMRPEDMRDIGTFYDVFEFDCTYAHKDYEWSKFDALYHVFFETESYAGNLQEINYQLRFPVNNETVLKHYANRTRCGMHCAQGTSCKQCMRHIELANMMHDKGYIFQERKEEVEDEQI